MHRSRYRKFAVLTIAALTVGGVFAFIIVHTDTSPVIHVPAPPSPVVKVPTEPGAVEETPRSPILLIVASLPGASAEDLERDVTIPLEKNLASIPHLESLWSKSAFGVCWIHARFEAGITYETARSVLLQRLNTIDNLKPGIVPCLMAHSGRHSLRYVLISPHDETGTQIYMLQDLRALQEQILERDFIRVPGIHDCESSGGMIKRYEIHPDPDRLVRNNVLYSQLETALANYAGDGLLIPPTVRNVGLFGDPAELSDAVLKAGTPEKAINLLRASEKQRLQAIRNQVVAMVNGLPVKIEDVVEGGRVRTEDLGKQGVVVGGKPRLDQVLLDGEDVVAGDVFLRPDEDPHLMSGARERIRQLNGAADRLLPGVRIETYYDSTEMKTNHLWVYGNLPTTFSLRQANELARAVNDLLHKLPEVDRVVVRFGCEEFGTNTEWFNQVQVFVSLKPDAGDAGTRQKLSREIRGRLLGLSPSVAWLTTTYDPMELGKYFPGMSAEHVFMLVGPDLEVLNRLSTHIKIRLEHVTGVENVGVFQTAGQPRVKFDIDPEKCKKWGVEPEDVKNIILRTTHEGKVISDDMTLQWPLPRGIRGPLPLGKEDLAILGAPLDLPNNKRDANDPPITNSPRLQDLVSPAGKDGQPDANKRFEPSPSTAVIYRKDGKRVLPIRFSVKGRSLAEVQAEVKEKIAPALTEPYRIEWGE
jgi:Cu/Ag efflux pump CusA